MAKDAGSGLGWRRLFGVLTAGFWVALAGAGWGAQEMRAGQISAVSQAGPFTFLEARDARGDEFLVVTTECRAHPGEAVVLEQGARYPDVEVRHLGRTVAEFYVARRLRIGERAVEGFSSDALPEGCVKRDPHGAPGGKEGKP